MNRKLNHIKKALLLSVLSTAAVITLSAQDLHFSQWYNSPLSTNPANTGFIPDADYRLGVNYRNQWSSVMNVPYKTYSVWGDAQVFREKIYSGWMGLGGMILRDVAGSGALTTTKAYASVAYHQMIGVAHLLSVGFNAGITNKRINQHDLRFPDQFDGYFFNHNIPSSVVIDNNHVNYLDMQVGVNYAYFPSKDVYINMGVAAWHLNRPRESFFDADVTGIDNRIAPRYTAFANAILKTSDEWIINPMGYYSHQAGASEYVLGMNAHYNLSGDGELQLIGGLFYRGGDAVIPQVGFQWKFLRMVFSYDATTSGMKNFNQMRGAFEFSLIAPGHYLPNSKEHRQTLCPTF
ncbi:PorP/SprF family type IX secretion system membrane protein [Gynurincola endophyticus]|jgi:type IX secretion system PorP/SprF family membrane protein|uniref:PorP/SprF family type IX secretion system membrane protein n=1 Tax=Gynurincola endophyticus TaxID=2479004 RepID=UPI000F8E4D0D|nr:PorP/SprF family type IX secretion system membrane protein [Gynurincola endophyticus]